MGFIPGFTLQLLNGWLFVAVYFIILGGIMLVLPKDVVARLYEKRPSNKVQDLSEKAASATFILNCLVVSFCPLRFDLPLLFWSGLGLFLLGEILFIISIINYYNTPKNQPVSVGIYKFSRNPQIVSTLVILTGVSLLVAHWIPLLLVVVEFIFMDIKIKAEEENCLLQYGHDYKAYMERSPRYFSLVTRRNKD